MCVCVCKNVDKLKMWSYLQYSLSIPSSLHFQIKISRQLRNKSTREEDFGKIHLEKKPHQKYTAWCFYCTQ